MPFRAKVDRICAKLSKGESVAFEVDDGIEHGSHDIEQISFVESVACGFLLGDGLRECEVVVAAIGVYHPMYDAELFILILSLVPSRTTQACTRAKFLCYNPLNRPPCYRYRIILS